MDITITERQRYTRLRIVANVTGAEPTLKSTTATIKYQPQQISVVYTRGGDGRWSVSHCVVSGPRMLKGDKPGSLVDDRFPSMPWVEKFVLDNRPQQEV